MTASDTVLTRAQQRTLNFLRHYFKEHGCSPTTREVAEGTGLRSRGVIYRHLLALESTGFIRLVPKKHRNIVLVESKESSQSLKLLGKIAAGQPIEAIENIDHITLSDFFLGDDLFALVVQGESMIDKGILDGDIVVCQKTESANDGDIVVALIEHEVATLKTIRFSDDKSTVTLVPANTSMQSLSFSSDLIQIQGRYIGLLRHHK